MRNLKILFQEKNYDCGIASVGMIYNHTFNRQEPLSYFSNFFPKQEEGLTLKEVEHFSKNINLEFESFQVNMEELKKELEKKPIICLVKQGDSFHYVVLIKTANTIIVFDPMSGKRKLCEKEFEKEFTNIVLILKKYKKPKRRNEIFYSLISKKRNIIKIFLYSFFTAVFTITSLYINRLIIQNLFSDIEKITILVSLAIMNIVILSFFGLVLNYVKFNIIKKYELDLFKSDLSQDSGEFLKRNNKLNLVIESTISLISNAISFSIIMMMSLIMFKTNLLFIYSLVVYGIMSILINAIIYFLNKNNVNEFLNINEKIFNIKSGSLKINKNNKLKILDEKHNIEKKMMLKNNFYGITFQASKKIIIYFILLVIVFLVKNQKTTIDQFYLLYFVFPIIFSKIDSMLSDIFNYKNVSKYFAETNIYFKEITDKKLPIKKLGSIVLNEVNLLNSFGFENNINMELQKINIFRLDNIKQENNLMRIFKLENNFFEGEILINNKLPEQIDKETYHGKMMSISSSMEIKDEYLIDYFSKDKEHMKSELKQIFKELKIPSNAKFKDYDNQYYMILFQLIHYRLWQQEQEIVFLSIKELRQKEKESIVNFIFNNIENKYFIIFD